MKQKGASTKLKFIDEATIDVEAGDGGDGCTAFRREAHVPRGGPSGGDGGRGGSVIFKGDPQMDTLLDHTYQRLYRAKRGGHGSGRDRTGAAGEDLVIPVPVSTQANPQSTVSDTRKRATRMARTRPYALRARSRLIPIHSMVG
mgnify:CR=1 FL=1